MGKGISLKSRIARWIAKRLPRAVLYYAVLRAEYRATEDGWPDDPPPLGRITVGQLISRLHVMGRDGKWKR